MLNKKLIMGLLGSVLLLALAWHFLWSATTPSGQPPLTYLKPDDPGHFQREFDGTAVNNRMVLLLSPT
jgi:hypothetical protein